jgi:hypothetical protein
MHTVPAMEHRPVHRRRSAPGFHGAVILCLVLAGAAPAQNAGEYQQILERLDRLEKQNRELLQEIAELRKELAAPRAQPETPVAQLEEKVQLHEQRIEDLAQTKVEASQHFPIRITGMALFNTYLNSSLNGGSDYPTVASLTPADNRGGGTFRQSVVGLDFRGPQTVWGGKVHGALFMDLFAGSNQPLNQLMRLRTASIEVEWKTRSVMAGLDKPLFAPREPNSLAQVGVSPLTATGNLWLWIPQVRFEQAFRLGESTRLRAQLGLVQTRESLSFPANNFVPELEPSRPGFEGRFAFSHGAEGGRRIEIAPGFHTSVSHVAHTPVPSNLISFDGFFNPLRKLEFTGAFFSGQNVAHLGTGLIRQGFTALGERMAFPIHTKGGWAQWTWLATSRLSFNFFTGVQDDRNRDLLPGRIGKNYKYGGNFFYRLAPNVLVSFETSQLRTTYIGIGNRLHNHYDLALAYLF